ncbi:MAG: hypothetical protein JWO51_2952 [Rhodospirillales bacterium]|nr:hypothetical protein [Rhodospirillales bacterium]
MFADIIAGDYPPLHGEAVEMIAFGWIRQATFPADLPVEDRLRDVAIPGYQPNGDQIVGGGFINQDALERSLRSFLVQSYPQVQLDGKAYPRILREAIQQHHDLFDDFTLAHERRADLTDRLRVELAKLKPVLARLGVAPVAAL